jgi:hypothetical protein
MFRNDAFGVLDRHFPSAEVDHRRAGIDVRVIQ